MLDMEQAIRERAYHMWNDAGRPDGAGDSFWLSAQREMLTASFARLATTNAPTKRKAPNTKTSTAQRKRKVA